MARTKATVTIVKPMVPQGVLRVREYLRDRTLAETTEFLLAVMQRGKKEESSPLDRQQGLQAAEAILTKLMGNPKEPFDEEQARGTIMVAQDMALGEATKAMEHLSSMPIDRYMALAERGVISAMPSSEEPT